MQPKDDKNEVEIEKSNMILVGETGTGKTLIAKNYCQNAQCAICYC